MKANRRLVEVLLPIREVSAESRREKNIRHGRISTLRIWWARRPLSASRATALAALLPDPGAEEERKALAELIKRISPWEAVKDGDLPAVREGKAGQRMVAVVLHHPGRQGKTYRLATDRDLEAYRAAEAALEEKRRQLQEEWGLDRCRVNLPRLEEGQGQRGLFRCTSMG